MFRLLFSHKWWWTTLLVVAGIGLAIRLGFWQVDRYDENKSFSDHLASMQATSSIFLSGGQPSVDLMGVEYRTVQANGTFDFAHQIAVRNQIWVQSWGDDTGYILVTPLIFSDGSAVLVDRGRIPMEDNTPESWRQFDQPGQISVTGIIRLPAKPMMGGVPDPTLALGIDSMDFWNIIDISRLQMQIPYKILSIYIEQAPDLSQSALPYRAFSEPDPTDAGTNAGYATMWFAFAVLLFVGYPVYLKKQVSDVIVVK